MNPHPATVACGVVVLHKPAGHSSAQYVYRLRRIFGIRKIGHAGTLDPFADGVLLGCVGRATRLVERLMALTKVYRTTLRLGVTNETFDPERPFVPVECAGPVAAERVAETVGRFVGEIDQAPPAFSAVKVKGVPSYRLAERGGAVDLPARRVRIDRMEIVRYEWPRLDLEIVCGRGTYIRAIARDLGAALGCGACCEALTRTAVGPFTLDEAVNLLEAAPDEVRGRLLSIEQVEARLGRTTK